MLYQLSYAHHDPAVAGTTQSLGHTAQRCRIGLAPWPVVAQEGSVRPVMEPPWRAASSLAVALSGPGGATKTASR